MNATAGLQADIEALAALSDTPASEWVAQVQSASDEVIAGAMLMWRPPGGGFSANPGDPFVIKREAAHAILQTRLSDRAVDASTKLCNTIDEYQRKSGRQTNWMLGLTIAIGALTAVQIWIAWCSASAVQP